MWEMGPLKPGGPIATSNTVDASTWSTAMTTQQAIAQGLTTEVQVPVSSSVMGDSMALYEAYWGGQPYQAFSHNSNFAVNSVMYGAGGPEQVQGLGAAPGFPDN